MTTKTLKASSGRPLPVHVSQHGSTLGAHCILNLAPTSCLTSAFVDTMASLMVYSHRHTHTYLRAPPKPPPRPEQSRRHPSPPQACAGGNSLWCLLKCLSSCRLTQVPWHGPSFLHGGLVWNCFLAYGDFLGRGWVSVGEGRGAVALVVEETFLSSTCRSHLPSLPRPTCSTGHSHKWPSGPVHPPPPPERPSVFVAPDPLAASVPTTRPGSKTPLIPQQIICSLCSMVNPSSEGPVLLSCMTHFIPFWDILTFCKRACFARKAAELMFHRNLMPCCRDLFV